MKITFHGAAQNVTGSKHLIETDEGFRLLLDCGFHQGHRKEAERLNRNFPIDAKEVDAVILSHAHLDHCGLLPVLIKQGYKGSIYATPATADVANYMLQDSAGIQEADAEYLNRHLKKGESLIKPLYTMEDCQQTVNRFQRAQYAKLGNKWTEINQNIRFKFYDAGHILGSAVIVLQIKDKGKAKTIAFTGDLGRKNAPILCDPEYIQEDVDILLSEATYGDRLHEPFERTEEFIQDIIEHTIKHQSKVIVPAFALGRTQELIYLLHRLFNIKGFPKIPIVLDSPLAAKVTEVFKKHRNVFDSQSWKDFNPVDDLPLVFNHLTFTQGVQDSIALNDTQGPIMIMSASGMMEAGRVLHHLKNNIENPNNTILITGYQAENTLGRRIQEGISPIRIFNKEYKVRAQIITAPSLSAHADQTELLEYISKTKGLKKLFLVHGEKQSMDVMAELAQKQSPQLEIMIPERGQSFDI